MPALAPDQGTALLRSARLPPRRAKAAQFYDERIVRRRECEPVVTAAGAIAFAFALHRCLGAEAGVGTIGTRVENVDLGRRQLSVQRSKSDASTTRVGMMDGISNWR